ncbi:MAG: 4Fe-4S binding protein, partial [Candidatus Hydrothermae bacterium]|nr:4Fe-4S binding protein [Candidatus Hydrothermae bacterium]
AIAWGRKAAISIDQFLNGQEFSPEARPPLVVGYKEIQTEYFLHEKRRDPKVLSVKERFEKPWDEEVLQLSETEAIKEAVRCFSCGHCNSCGNCWVYCPDQSILWVDNAPQVDYDYCKGCGICTMECPRGIIDLVPERE